jgi:transcriptional regulator with XRE-family HTH domain
MNKEQIGKFIREKRIELNLSQTQLAEMANVSYRRVLDIELNKRNFSIDVGIDILGALGCDLTITQRESIVVGGNRWNFKKIKPIEDTLQWNNSKFNGFGMAKV